MPKLEEIVSKTPLFKQRVEEFHITRPEDHRLLLSAFVSVVKDALVRRGGLEFGPDYEDGANALYKVYTHFLSEGKFPMENGQIPLDAKDRFKKTYEDDLASLGRFAQGIKFEPAGAEYALAGARR